MSSSILLNGNLGGDAGLRPREHASSAAATYIVETVPLTPQHTTPGTNVWKSIITAYAAATSVASRLPPLGTVIVAVCSSPNGNPQGRVRVLIVAVSSGAPVKSYALDSGSDRDTSMGHFGHLGGHSGGHLMPHRSHLRRARRGATHGTTHDFTCTGPQCNCARRTHMRQRARQQPRAHVTLHLMGHTGGELRSPRARARAGVMHSACHTACEPDVHEVETVRGAHGEHEVHGAAAQPLQDVLDALLDRGQVDRREDGAREILRSGRDEAEK